jgi:hypothetical protein
MLVKPDLIQLFPKKIAMELAIGQIYPRATGTGTEKRILETLLFISANEVKIGYNHYLDDHPLEDVLLVRVERTE